MKLIIDQEVLKKHNLTICEFMLLYLNERSVDIESCVKSLATKELVHKELFSEIVEISDKGKKVLNDIVAHSDKGIISEDEEFTSLATELRELYPSGRKEGTCYMWRGTVAEVAKKLKTLVVKYKYSFTREQAIKATKEYVSSFNGNYKRMRLLKYFILKSERDADDNINVISELMSLIENEGQIESKREDWMSTMI